MTTLTEAQILAISVPELMFTGEIATAKAEYRKLASKWHTDTNPGVNPKVISHINMLYDLAVKKLTSGDWVIPGLFQFETVQGKKFQLKYRRKHDIDLGEMYVGDNFVVFSVFKTDSDLVETAKKIINEFQYPNDKMRDEMSRFLPSVHDCHETSDRHVLLVKKTSDVFLLRDVIDHFGGKLDPKHAAWVISRLYNLACYLKFSGLVHCGISPMSVFISPKYHSGLLLGDWWYTTKVKQQMVALPSTTIILLTDSELKAKEAKFSFDLEAIRAIGREMLGDRHGSKLLMDKSLPKALVAWARSPATGDAFKEYDYWQSTVLIESFGKRKFVELDLSSSDIYKGA